MSHSIYIYILIMGVVTYLIRVLPLTWIRKPINNITIRSFLFYVPYVTLAVMTFPAILSATESIYSGWAALSVGALLSWKKAGLLVVAAGACITVFVLELFLC